MSKATAESARARRALKRMEKNKYVSDERRALSDMRAAAGRKGGLRTAKKGKRFMRKLARWGAHVMHATYDLMPVALNDFALVHKVKGTVKAYLSGKPVQVTQ